MCGAEFRTKTELVKHKQHTHVVIQVISLLSKHTYTLTYWECFVFLDMFLLIKSVCAGPLQPPPH